MVREAAIERGEPARFVRVSEAGGSASGRAALPWWWAASLIALGLAMALFRLVPTEADPDLWGHLRFGLDLLQTGRVVRPDPYSYLTAGERWINHEWLAEAIMAVGWRAGGAAALVAVKVLLALAVAVIVGRHLVQRGVSLLPSLLLTAYGMAVILPGWRSLRPQAFTYLLFAALLVVVHRASRGRIAWLWLAPPILALWANLHGGFVAGAGVMLLWAAAEAADAWRRRTRATPARLTPARLTRARPAPIVVAAIGATIGAIGATLITPYGWTLWTFLARTLGPRPDIAEWQPVPLATVQGAAYLAVLLLGAFGLIGSRRPRHPIDVLLCACGALLPLVAQRHLPLCVLITLVFAGEHIASAASTLTARLFPDAAAPPKAAGRASGDRFRPLVAGALLAEAFVLVWLTVTAPAVGQIVYQAGEYPVAATARLADSGISANLAVFFDWGEYVLWHAGPRVKVSVDGRRETVYGDAVYEENMSFTDGQPEAWDRLLTRRPTDLALVSVVTPAYRRLAAHPEWALIARDGPAALFGRRGAPATARLRAIPPRALPASRSLIFP